ncbi:MAG: beta-glucosidase [Burkholderiales bacterium]|nr:beta-glucosidase [Burkholderiales bacterium]
MTTHHVKDDQSGADLSRINFPSNFVWGCATSSFQVEGAAHVGGREESIWDRFCKKSGVIRDGSDAQVACDHFHRWPQDLDLARSMGLNAYRFSIAWTRIMLADNATPNQAGLDFYARMIDGMLERGLQPWVTLYHWDLPQSLQEAGGWENRATVDAYVRYVDAVTRVFGDRVKHWITHNEPWCSAMHGHWDGQHAPGKTDLKSALQACHHILLSHGMAVPVVRRNVAQAQVGIALSLHPLYPASASEDDQRATQRHDGIRNRWFLDALAGRGYPEDVWQLCANERPVVQEGDMQNIAAPLDFLGVNYYFPEAIAHCVERLPFQAQVVHRADRERTAFNWEVAPRDLLPLLQRLQNDYPFPPMFITENGATYEDVVSADGRIHDVERRAYFQRHLKVVKQAIALGIDVRGYFAWSLMDNFEWAEGYQRRFGLVHVDFETQQRLIKDSGLWFREFLLGDESGISDS